MVAQFPIDRDIKKGRHMREEVNADAGQTAKSLSGSERAFFTRQYLC
jgi:hypothetical protein